MTNAQLLALYDKEMRIEVEYPGIRKEILEHVVRFTGTPEPNGCNFVLFSSLNNDNTDQVIEAQIRYFQSIGHPFEWKAYDHDQPADLRHRLSAHGLVLPESADAIMALELSEAPQILLEPVKADVRRLTDPDQLAQLLPVLETVWEEEFGWLLSILGNDMHSNPDFLSVYVGYVNNEPACTGWINFHPNSHFASVWGGSTLPQYRRQGLYTAVMAARVQEAIQRGFDYLAVDASPMNRPIAASRGFQLLTYAHACKWQPEQSS